MLSGARPARPATRRVGRDVEAIATFRSSIEAVIDTLKERFPLAAHAANQFWGLLLRTAAKIATATFAKLWPLNLIPT